jgi:DNA mismatch endonuclease (patch repair protein)
MAVSVEQRSACMRAVKSKNTIPEMSVRRLVHSMGYRYSLHTKTLPGKPDLALVSRRKVIFVHGCFWHKHACSHGLTSPVTNSSYWEAKRTKNVERDKVNIRTLRKEGWKVLVVWECWTRDTKFLRRHINAFLHRTA